MRVVAVVAVVSSMDGSHHMYVCIYIYALWEVTTKSSNTEKKTCIYSVHVCVCIYAYYIYIYTDTY